MEEERVLTERELKAFNRNMELIDKYGYHPLAFSSYDLFGNKVVWTRKDHLVTVGIIILMLSFSGGLAYLLSILFPIN